MGEDKGRIIALAGNPNVGKSTVFNELTGMNQHTGNWPGKTVSTARGVSRYKGMEYTLVDLPGTYSVAAHSPEEEVARDFILFGGADATIVVCDATCLERNLNLVLQIMEITPDVVVCINLMDEAEKKGICINRDILEKSLGVPVVCTSARSRKGLDELLEQVMSICSMSTCSMSTEYFKIEYDPIIRSAVDLFNEPLADITGHYRKINPIWLALKILEGEEVDRISENLGIDLMSDTEIQAAAEHGKALLEENQISVDKLKDMVVSAVVLSAEKIAGMAVVTRQSCSECNECSAGSQRDRKLDRILTSKHTGIPIMLALLCGVFWLTITGANYPSQLLSGLLFTVQDWLTAFFRWIGAPEWVHGMLVLGMYRVLAWVVSVMLPPMAIFFPLFTLLEDFGYLPRVAFNLDHQFKKAKACGKQALTMCMGFGCNAAGVVGCRIIDSPRERLIAIITNNFVPCNGRFPPPHKG